MKTYYEIGNYSTEIRALKIVKETEHTVTVSSNRFGGTVPTEVRVNRHTTYSHVYQTFEEAKQAIIKDLTIKSNRARMKSDVASRTSKKSDK